MPTSTTKLTGFRLLAFIATLLAGTFTMSISQSALSTAYPTLMRYFAISASTVQWLTTGFMLVMCVMMPVSPWLLDNLPFKPLFLSILGLFIGGTTLIIWAPNFGLVLLGRAGEAIAVSVLFPAFQTVLLTITPAHKRGQIMGVAGLVMGSALACGPIISGLILNYFSWQALFIVFNLIISFVFILAWLTITNVMPYQPYDLDYQSISCMPGLIGLLYVISTGNQPQLSWPWLWLILGISLCMLGYFIHRQLTQATPLLNLSILHFKNYRIAVTLTALSYLSLIITTVIYPLYFQSILHLSPLVSGLALVPAAVVLSLLNPLTGKLADRVGFKPTLLLGLIMIMFGWLNLLLLAHKLTLPIMLVNACLIEGGNAFVMMPAVTLGANNIPAQQLADGTAVTTTIRQISGALGVALVTLVITNFNATQAYPIIFGTLLGLTIVGLRLAFSLKTQ